MYPTKMLVASMIHHLVKFNKLVVVLTNIFSAVYNLFDAHKLVENQRGVGIHVSNNVRVRL